MYEALAITVFPVLFVVVLFSGGAAFGASTSTWTVSRQSTGERSTSANTPSSSSGAPWSARRGGTAVVVDLPAASRWAGLLLWVAGFLVLFVGRFGLGVPFKSDRRRSRRT